MGKSVVLGLSGGVDSAVAAQCLLDRGFSVTGVFLDIGLGGEEDAQAVARTLDIPFQVVNIKKKLEENVCHYFEESYLRGETPLPCAVCNHFVKFPALLEVADQLGAELVATGHYARVADEAATGKVYLLRGQPENDQSYMLSRLTREQLQRVIFPLGDYEKPDVRAMAEEFGIPVAHKPDSMEICFIPDNDYAAWLDRRGSTPGAGDYVDASGTVLGRHQGYHHYTLGQGRGLGISGPHKYYVSALRPEENQVVLSDGTDLFTHEVFCRDLNWLSIDALSAPKVVTARFRHSKAETAAVLFPQEDGTVLAQCGSAVRAATPGQLAVFYEGDLVVGSGWIRKRPEGK